MSVNRTGPDSIARRAARLLVRGDGERYAYPARAEARLIELVAEAASAPESVSAVGALLKLVHVLRTRHASPGAADALLDAVMTEPTARRVVLTRWTAGRAPRRGADLEPLKRGLAPHVDARRPERAVALSRLVDPGRMDPRTRMLRERAEKGRRS